MQDEKIFQVYEGFFGSALARDGFGLQGEGRLFINSAKGTLELSAERPLPMLFTLPLMMLTFKRLSRTLYRPATTYLVPVNQIKDLTQEGRVIRFRAPKNGGPIKQTKFTAQREAEAQEIYNTINRVSLMHKDAENKLPR